MQNDFAFSGKPLILSTDEVYFVGDSAAGGLWFHQQWSILPRIRNQVEIAISGNFLRLTRKIT